MANDRARFPDKRQNPDPPGASGVTQNVVVLNDFSGVTFDERTRTTATGSTSVRYSLSIEAEPLLNILDGVYLGAKPANAIRDILSEETKDIGEVAKPATLAMRQRFADAINGNVGPSKRYRGAPASRGIAQVARERYDKGRSAEQPIPNSKGVRVGNDSGRLADGWFVRQNPVEQSFTINVPANRFDPRTWGGDLSTLQAWVTRFVSLVPALREPRSILGDKRFERAVAESPPVVSLNKAPQWIGTARAVFAGVLKVARAGGLKFGG